MNCTLSWDSRVCRGFRYDQETGDLLVPEDGRYLVYFQLTYRGHLNCTKPLMLVQRVVYVQESYPKELDLLAVQDTLPCMDYLTKTMQASISYDLVKNDRLRVRLNTPKLLYKGFLGADLLNAIQPDRSLRDGEEEEEEWVEEEEEEWVEEEEEWVEEEQDLSFGNI
ncbi:unnamed protein product [Merluccius merluccius]